MLPHTMKTDPEAARTVMSPLAWKCCAAQTPAGHLYEGIVTRTARPASLLQPDSWGSALGAKATKMSSMFAGGGLILLTPLLQLQGTGVGFDRGTGWHCGITSWATVAAVDWMTQSLSRRPAGHLLAAALVVGWPARELSRIAILTVVLLLGCCGGLLGAVVGAASYAASLHQSPQYKTALEDIVRYRNEVPQFSHMPRNLLNELIFTLEARLGRRLHETERKNASDMVADHIKQSAERIKVIREREVYVRNELARRENAKEGGTGPKYG